MRQQRGVVLEVEDRWAVVLTPDGGFVRLRVPAERWMPGQEVTWGALPRFSWRPALALACSLLLLLGGGGVAYQHYFALGPVVAYVSVDINPSLELGVDGRERVCTAEGLNQDGVKLLEGLRYRRRPLERVLAELTLRAAERGYLSGEEEGEILITVTPVSSQAQAQAQTPGPTPVTRDTPPVSPTTPPTEPTTPPGQSTTPPVQPDTLPVQPGGNDGPGKGASKGPGKDVGRPETTRRDGAGGPVGVETRIRQEAAAVATRVLKEHGIKAAVHTLTTDASLRDEAKELHMSAGRLAVYLTARDAGLDIPLDELRQGPLTHVFREAWENLKSRAGGKESPPEGSGAPAAPGAPGTPGKPEKGGVPPTSVAVPPDHGPAPKPESKKETAPASGQKKGASPAATPGDGVPDGSQRSVVPPGEGKTGDTGGQGPGPLPQRPAGEKPGGEEDDRDRPGAVTPDKLKEKWREKWKQMIERPDIEKELRGLLQKFTELGGHKGEPGQDKGRVLQPEQDR